MPQRKPSKETRAAERPLASILKILTDGILSVRGAKNTQGASPAELARSYAQAIEDQIGEAKTATGLEGVWSRNEKVINRLQDSWPGDYSNVFDVYAAKEAELKSA